MSKEHKNEKFVKIKERKRQAPLAAPAVPRPRLVLRGRGRKGSPQLPPEINVTPKLRHVFRFTGGGTTVTVTTGQILGALGGVCTVTNSTFRPWASTFRIRKLTIWSDVTSSEQNAYIQWSSALGGQVRDEEKVRSFPTGVTITAPLVSTPPPGTLAALWQDSSSNGIVVFFANPGSIIDLDVEFTLTNAIVTATQPITTGTLGSPYYLALDGPSSNVYVPVGLLSTH
jgi:hypothetical protein